MLEKHDFKIKLILVIVFILNGCMLIKLGFNDTSYDQVTFNEKSNIDYQVYLKPNNFFEAPFLQRDDNKAYITSLIDHLNVDTNYTVSLNEKRSGSYKYSVIAQIDAETQAGSSSYWSKKFVLVDEVIKEFNNQNIININEKFEVDYQKYNDLLTQFKKEYELSIKGVLKIFFNIETSIENKLNGEPLTSNLVSSLTIPLSKATIEIPIEIDSPSNSKVIKSTIIYDESTKYSIYKILGFTFVIIGGLLLIILLIKYIKKRMNTFDYNAELKHILKTYDAIIVNVSQMPSFNGVKVIKVSKFSELLDAHSEIRHPINFYEEKNRANFILFNDNIAWYYSLEKR